MHWFVCKDNRNPAGDESAVRSGRLYVYLTKNRSAHIGWSFWSSLRNIGASIRLSQDDGLSLSVTLWRLAHLWITVPLPLRLVQPFMIEDRVCSLRLGYIGDIAWIQFWHAEWAEDCGMTSYYRKQNPRKYTRVQLWPGWEIKLKWPPVLDWVFGRARFESRTRKTETIKFWMDGREIEALWSLKEHWRWRPRWPWRYRVWHGSSFDVEKPPMFAGKGENSWDCDDDCILGMSTNETSVSGAVGRYITAVLENRERYGLPSQLRGQE